ncbi:uncharacterized protein [Dermacentor andersoni]|uniref:uncharacterized protein n=1 Tax=Dermacentor andersoni TaxID=34620 RepID=UPI003B3A4713
MAAARIQRWSLLLGAYQYKIEYKPGSDNLNADALSRLPLETTEDTSEELHQYVHSLQQLDDTPLSSQAMRQLTEKDQVLGIVKPYMLHGWPRERKAPDLRLDQYFTRKSELTVYKGLIYWSHKILIPEASQGDMLQFLHETHQGMSAMKALARTVVW